MIRRIPRDLTDLPPLRHHRLWTVLAAASALTLLVQLPGPHATAWHFFDDAARLLVGSGPDGVADGLHLYRDRPDFQFGPLSIVTAVPFSMAGPTAGAWLAMVTASFGGLLTYALLLDTAETLRPGFRRSTPPAVLLAGGILVVVTWGDVAVRTAHIDDALAWLAVAAALRWTARRQATAVMLALAVAAAAKPWAIMFAPLVLAAHTARDRTGDATTVGAGPPRDPDTHPDLAEVAGGWLREHQGVHEVNAGAIGGAANFGSGQMRYGLARLAVVGLLAGLTWLPFVLAEPATLDTSEFGITNDTTSVLRALGVADDETPSWARPAQLGGGLALVALVVVSGRWQAAVLAGAAWRLLLEPGANRYYTVGLVLGAVLIELLARRDRLPWATVTGAAVLELTGVPDFPGLPGRYLRLACVATALALVWIWCRPARRDRDGPGTTGLSDGPPAEPVTHLGELTQDAGS